MTQPAPLRSQDLGGALLASVSRSFYLSIKVLPAKVRGPLGVAYLLARATDTIADTTAAPAESRLTHLQSLAGMISSGPDAEKILGMQKEIVPAGPAERELLARIGPCLDWLRAQPEADRADIVDVLGKIIHGQRLDIMRFPDPSRQDALRNADELDEYTYLVAGCVGEFWTKICFRNLPHYAQLDGETVRRMGVNFGKGLQLVNILRDLPADLKAGRCYLPADELKAAGVDPTRVMESPELARPVFDRWLKKAAGHLDEGFRYIEVLSNKRVRMACILPWALGVRTLALISEKFPLTAAERVKVPRTEVKRLLWTAPFAALSNKRLRRMRAKLKI